MSNKNYHSGYDYFTPDPGTWNECHCVACGNLMDVRRDCNGPTGFAMAMGKLKRKHDVFSCPNVGLDWHDQLIALDKELRRTSSAQVAALIEAEIKTVKETRVATRKAASPYGI